MQHGVIDRVAQRTEDVDLAVRRLLQDRKGLIRMGRDDRRIELLDAVSVVAHRHPVFVPDDRAHGYPESH